MYEKGESDIFLWVQAVDNDENDSESSEPERKRKKQPSREEELEEIFKKLKNEHDSGEYSHPQLKLWAKMILNGTHCDYKSPPRVPMITGMHPKHPKKDVVTDAIAGAVMRAFSPPPVLPNDVATSRASTSATHKDSTDVRMKNFEQLRMLQKLHDDNIITNAELLEQKTIIMEVLRNL
jgi:hypothetical protein